MALTGVDCLLVLDGLTSIVAPMLSIACLIIDKLGFVYREVGKDRVVNECGLSGMLLGND